jgi:hypothetical protein
MWRRRSAPSCDQLSRHRGGTSLVHRSVVLQILHIQAEPQCFLLVLGWPWCKLLVFGTGSWRLSQRTWTWGTTYLLSIIMIILLLFWQQHGGWGLSGSPGLSWVGCIWAGRSALAFAVTWARSHLSAVSGEVNAYRHGSVLLLPSPYPVYSHNINRFVHIKLSATAYRSPVQLYHQKYFEAKKNLRLAFPIVFRAAQVSMKLFSVPIPPNRVTVSFFFFFSTG